MRTDLRNPGVLPEPQLVPPRVAPAHALDAPVEESRGLDRRLPGKRVPARSMRR